MNAAIQISLAALFLAACAFAQDDVHSWMNKGIDEYRHGRSTEAVQCFEHAVKLDPRSVDARVSLAAAYLTTYVAGVDSPENHSVGRNIEENLREALKIDPRNSIALGYLAQFCYWEALTTPEKAERLNQAKQLYEQIAGINANSKEAYYALGVIAWQDSNRQLDDAIKQLSRALEIDPSYEDAMDYLSVVLREKGAGAAADEWAARARRIRAEKAEKWRAAHPKSAAKKPCPAGTICFDPDPASVNALPLAWPPSPFVLMAPPPPPPPPPPPLPR